MHGAHKHGQAVQAAEHGNDMRANRDDTKYLCSIKGVEFHARGQIKQCRYAAEKIILSSISGHLSSMTNHSMLCAVMIRNTICTCGSTHTELLEQKWQTGWQEKKQPRPRLGTKATMVSQQQNKMCTAPVQEQRTLLQLAQTLLQTSECASASRLC